VIGWLGGRFRGRDMDGRVIIDCAGVGYCVSVPLAVLGQATPGQAVELHIHTGVREDDLALFGFDAFAALARVPWVVAGQAASASAMFAFFFRLQAVGGPVYLSQIGYVAAAVGLFSGTLFLGEQYQLLTWAGAAIIVAGVFITTRAQRQG